MARNAPASFSQFPHHHQQTKEQPPSVRVMEERKLNTADLFAKLAQWLLPNQHPHRATIGNDATRQRREAMLQLLPLVSFAAVLLAVWAAGEMPFETPLWMLLKRYRLPVLFWLIAGACGLHWYTRRPRPVYLVDFSCFKPSEDQRINYELAEYITRRTERFTLPSMVFQRKILTRSGLGEETYVPRFMFCDRSVPQLADAVQETEQMIFGAVDDLLCKTGVSASEISIVITNCSLFSPAPSFCSMLVNQYKMREDVKCFHLSGMGCSASLIACHLASDLLKMRPNEYALVVSTENVTLNWYSGNVKPMLVTNCLFRLGSAAMLLTNKQTERSRSKYEFLHCVRTHKAADDRAYGCAFQREDEVGTVGVSLDKHLMEVAADALRTNIRGLAPRILPLSEQLWFAFSLLCREILQLKVAQYQPDFKVAVQHFCLHAGGRAVIDAIQKNLHLEDYDMEPARATLHRFGNTSASCLWYVFAYMEAKQRVRNGDKVWMLGLGSGFKCNSLIWKALNVNGVPVPRSSTAWADCIHRYPGILLV